MTKAEEIRADLSPDDVAHLADENCECYDSETPGVVHKHGDTHSMCWTYCECVERRLAERGDNERTH